MKTDTPQTVYLKDYTPPAFWIDTVDLDFDIDAGGTTVSATLALRRNAARPAASLPSNVSSVHSRKWLTASRLRVYSGSDSSATSRSIRNSNDRS